MEIQKLLFFSSFFFLVSLVRGNQYCLGGSSNDHLLSRHCVVDGFWPEKLFVFGDSYVDTGNTNKSISIAWKEPYGITFPGKPGGRFSDGQVLSEYLAMYLGLESPIPYEQREIVPPEQWQYGMNFAYGGSGVFETLEPVQNMSRQIDFLQDLIDNGTAYNKSDLSSSLALVTLSGNDYLTYLKNQSDWDLIGLLGFIQKVVEQLGKNLERIHEMGMKKIVVTLIQPLGCLPGFAETNSYQNCDDTVNLGAMVHNSFLKENVEKLNNETSDSSSFVVLDLYAAFNSVIFENEGATQGSVKFETPLKPCCLGNCSVEGQNTLCEDPGAAFFWDTAHPTQAGWEAVFSVAYPSLQQVS